jgi:hypothetical protein
VPLSLGVHVIVLAAQRTVPAQDGDGFSYALAGVVLLVVGCMLSIFATARRTARSPKPESLERAPVPATSASVTRLLRDVSGWTSRRERKGSAGAA